MNARNHRNELRDLIFATARLVAFFDDWEDHPVSWEDLMEIDIPASAPEMSQKVAVAIRREGMGSRYHHDSQQECIDILLVLSDFGGGQ